MTKTQAILASILDDHSFEWKIEEDGLYAKEVFNLNGQPGFEWVDVSSMSVNELYLWIGY